MHDTYTTTQDTVITTGSADLPVYTFLVLLRLRLA